MLFPVIPTRVHGIIDYLVGLLLIAAPWLFHFTDNRAAMLVPICLGLSTIVYSLITNYELGVVHLLPMSAHLWIDLMSGLLLAASPWLFGFSGRIVWPHVTFGLMEIVAVSLTSRVPSAVSDNVMNTGNMDRPGTI